MALAFWLLISLVFYCYFAYPALLWVFAKFNPRPIRKGPQDPSVSVILSVWNEADVIERKLQNLLSLDYPAGKTEIFIGSDGSTDRTNDILLGLRDPRLHVVINEQRRGKMATINDLVSRAGNEVLVFTDARQEFAPDAVRELVANFADPQVGCVSGELIFQETGKEGATAKGVGLYWHYEKFMRRQESRIHSMLGATGAIYAVRRALFEPIPEHVVLDDMFVPLALIRKGYRAILDGAAVAYDQAADSPREEHRRKTRTLFGNYQIFGLFPDLLNPFKSPVAVQLFSHKLLRVLVPLFLIAIFGLNAALMGEGGYRALFYAQILFYVMAVTGALARHQKYGIFKPIAKLCSMPYVFCLLNFSALVGFMDFITGKQKVTWKKAREGEVRKT